MTARGHIRSLLADVRPYRKEYAGSLLCLGIVALLYLAVTRWVQYLVNDVLADLDLVKLTGALAIGVLLVGSAAVFSFGRDALLLRLVHRITARIRMRMFDRILMMPTRMLSKRRAGELLSRLSNDIQMLHESLSRGMAVLLPNIVIFLCLTLWMFWLSWRMSILTLVAVLPLALTVTFFARRIRTAVHESQSRVADLMTLLEEAVLGIKEIKSFVREEHMSKLFGKRNELSLKTNIAHETIFALHGPMITLVTGFCVAGLIFTGAWSLTRGYLEPEDLAAFVSSMAIVGMSLQEVARSAGYLGRFFAVMDRCEEIMHAETEDDPHSRLPVLSDVAGGIRFEHVTFSYEREGFQLQDIDLEIAPGETIAIVGPSGAGKSTLVDLIPRFLNPSAGTVAIDGNNIADYRLDSLRRQIAIVPQEPVLFEGTLLENLRLGKLDASMEEITAAARAAHVEEFVEKLPLGYETEVGQRGSNLSVGQRQRIAIARALLKNPRILILDEPTSALDSESERLVQQALTRLLEGRTTVIIAHRMSMIRDVDRIVVLNDGRIVEIDSHQKLLDRKGLYHTLYVNQALTGAEV